jgi:hypothetical protein
MSIDHDHDAIAEVLDRHYLAHCVANPSSLYGNNPSGRYWKCGCGAEESHVPEGITIKRAHHRHVAKVIAHLPRTRRAGGMAPGDSR